MGKEVVGGALLARSLFLASPLTGETRREINKAPREKEKRIEKKNWKRIGDGVPSQRQRR